MTEDEMVRYHYQLNGHESEQILGESGGQRSLACCSLWGSKELYGTEEQKQGGVLLAEAITW